MGLPPSGKESGQQWNLIEVVKYYHWIWKRF